MTTWNFYGTPARIPLVGGGILTARVPAQAAAQQRGEGLRIGDAQLPGEHGLGHAGAPGPAGTSAPDRVQATVLLDGGLLQGQRPGLFDLLSQPVQIHLLPP